MRSTIRILAVLLAPATLQLAAAASSVPRQASTQLLSSAKCNSFFEQVCDTGCMFAGDTCCNDGTSESCSAGYYCTTTACCPRGQVCDEPPVPGSQTSALSVLPGFTATWTSFPTSIPDDVASATNDNVSTYSFSFQVQPTPSQGDAGATTQDAAAGATGTAAGSPPPTLPLGSTGAAAGQFVVGGRAVAGLAAVAVGLLI